METVNLSLVISIAALLLSFLSPFLSALINGAFRLKEKKLDISAAREKEQQSFYIQHRAEVIERYISTAGAALKNPCTETMKNYGASIGEVYLYVDSSLWPEIDKLDSLVRYHADNSPGITLLNSICKSLSLIEVRPKYQPDPKRNKKK